ncbi:hypothetical protein [Actinophytocola sp.]|jgi:hypothetical protein|uniref:hypothetical protein n=1 Tax=Actinophytocola sp. TaxID=1872138 RepID=UPI002ED7A499
MRSATRLVIVGLLSLFLALPVGTAAAEPATHVFAEQPTTTAPSAPGATAPSVPINKPQTEADKAESRRKLVMGVTSVVLVGLVIWGRSVRRKRRKKAEGGGGG